VNYTAVAPKASGGVCRQGSLKPSEPDFVLKMVPKSALQCNAVLKFVTHVREMLQLIAFIFGLLMKHQLDDVISKHKSKTRMVGIAAAEMFGRKV
jgi:hypothetical protein